MMSSSLVPSYPEGDHLEGNFITDYVNGYTYFDRNVARKYGERGIEVDYDTTIAEASADWLQDVNSIVFQHLNDWAKMYSALIKDYEPLWNVDGTVITTYGATENNDQYGATQKTRQYGATQDTMQHGAVTTTDTFGATQDTTQYGATSETQGGGTDTHNHYERSYPDSTEVKTSKDEDIIASRTNTSTQHSDVESSIQHIDTHGTTQYSDVNSSIQHTDIESDLLHSDKHTGKEHVDTERRTGNIGVTKSTELVESEARLRITYNFFDIIFKFMMKEMGVIYYDWY